MTAPYILYGSPLSPFQRKVEAVLSLKGQEYDCEPVSIPGPPDWYREINPLGSIPTLRDTAIGSEGADGTICDSSAICAYLEKNIRNNAYIQQIHSTMGVCCGLRSFPTPALPQRAG